MSNKLLIAYFEMMHSEQGEKECPKMMYYSTTRSALYIMHQSYSMNDWFKVSVIYVGMDGHVVETFKLSMPYGEFLEALGKFNSFIYKHINREAFEELLFKN